MGDQPPITPSADSDMVDLAEVDPSPVDETPVDVKETYFTSQPSPRSSSPGTSGLGLGNHGPAYYLTRLQKYSTYTFTLFTAMHLTNTSLIPLLTRSVPESNRYLLLTRPYYQSLLAEPLLVAIPLVTHVASGVALRFYRRRQALKRYGAEEREDRRSIPWPRFSGTSVLGYATTVVVGAHVWTTRILPMYMHGDSSLISLSYVSHSFELFPYLGFAGMSALVGVSVWHVVWGWAKWLGWSPEYTNAGDRLTRKRKWYIINAVSAAVTGLWMAGGLGVVGRAGKTIGWVGKEFDELYRCLPVIGRWAFVASIP